MLNVYFYALNIKSLC